MLVLLPSSKTLSFQIKEFSLVTLPQLIDFTKDLHKTYSSYSIEEISKKMKCSESIAKKTYGQFQEMQFPHTISNAAPALYTFKGDVYKHVGVEDYSKKDLDFAQKHLRILSGFYGVLRPLDLMQPYRLEMALTVSFWKEKVTDLIDNEKDEIIVNLASMEYFNVCKNTKKKVITPVFKEDKNGVYKIVTIYTKYARGLMADWIIKNKITRPDDLKKFSLQGYSYSDDLSDGDVIVFVR